MVYLTLDQLIEVRILAGQPRYLYRKQPLTETWAAVLFLKEFKQMAVPITVFRRACEISTS